MKKISIIIPFHGQAKLLLNCLASLNHQIRESPEFEVIISDNNINSLPESVKTSFPKNVKYLFEAHHANSCAARARNMGAREAQSDVLLFLDSDILVEPDFVLKHYEEHIQHPNCLTMGQRFFLAEETLPDIQTLMSERDTFLIEFREKMVKIYGSMDNLATKWIHVITHNLCVQAQPFWDVGGFLEKFKKWGMEDSEFGCRWLLAGYKINYQSEIRCYHQFHGTRYNPTDFIRNCELFQSDYPNEWAKCFGRMAKNNIFTFYNYENCMRILKYKKGKVI